MRLATIGNKIEDLDEQHLTSISMDVIFSPNPSLKPSAALNIELLVERDEILPIFPIPHL